MRITSGTELGVALAVVAGRVASRTRACCRRFEVAAGTGLKAMSRSRELVGELVGTYRAESLVFIFAGFTGDITWDAFERCLVVSSLALGAAQATATDGLLVSVEVFALGPRLGPAARAVSTIIF